MWHWYFPARHQAWYISVFYKHYSGKNTVYPWFADDTLLYILKIKWCVVTLVDSLHMSPICSFAWKWTYYISLYNLFPVMTCQLSNRIDYLFIFKTHTSIHNSSCPRWQTSSCACGTHLFMVNSDCGVTATNTNLLLSPGNQECLLYTI